MELPDPAIPIEHCDQVLGYYLRTWNQLEFSLAAMVQSLLGTDQKRSFVVLQNVQHAALRDLLQHLGTYYLTKEDQSALDSIMREIKSLAGVRNRLVHGQWAIHIKRAEGKILSADFSRDPFILDANDQREMYDPKNQRAKHLRKRNYLLPEQIIEEAEKLRPIADRLNELAANAVVSPDHPVEPKSRPKRATRIPKTKSAR